MTPDGKLSAQECAQLAATEQTSGHKVFLEIAAREIENLRIDLENTDPSEDKKVLANQAIVHGAQKFWNKVLEEVHTAVEHSRTLPPPELSKQEKEERRDASILDVRVPE
jgi:hypothetical protein